MNKIFPRIIRYLLIVILISFYFNSTAQSIIWSEDFNSYTSGTGIDGNGNIGDYPTQVSKWTLDVSSGSLQNDEDYIKTVSGQMEARDVDGEMRLSTQSINLSSYSLINISIDASESGNLRNSDYIRVSYQLNGGVKTQFGYDQNDFTSTTYTVSNLDVSSNTSITIIVELNSTNGSRYVRFDNIVVEDATKPEPTNHPTVFAAVPISTSEIDLSWVDATGAQLPDAYLIQANTTGLFTSPVDGTEPPADVDLSDGSALVKVNYGVESYSFSGLNANTHYYFKIYPYTNSGSSIDYKTNGTVPTADNTTFGLADFFYYVSDNDNELFTINRLTGACSSIGATGRSYIEAIANWPARNNQVLYATDEGDFGTLNTSTGAFTLIQDVDVDGPAHGAEGAQALDDIDGLTIDPRTGTMWASHRRSGTFDLLFQINKKTGKYVNDAFGPGVDYIVIAGTGVYEDFDDMAVSPADGTLYGVSNNGSQDQVLEINKTTGAVSVVSSLSSISDVEGLGFSNDNHMYGTSGAADDFAEIFWTTGASSTISSNMCGGGDPESLAALVENANYISGRVYHDDNQNQVDDSETGLSGVVVELYYDVNGNGAVDAGDEFLTTATTDGNGDYYFDYASVGDLVMQIDLSTLPSGYALTTNNVEVASFASQDNADTGNDFGADTGSDCDGNGIPDFTEGTADSDGDGISNQCDLDNDNDGILDSEEGIGDFDGDGIPNYLDLDSDNDGIPDAIEANGGSAPSGYSSSTGRISGSDSDSDGLLDVVDNAPYVQYGVGSTSTLPRGDHDGDGYADYKDKDSDNDGILDVLEAGGTDSNGDGEIDGFSDSNSDGYHDALTSSPLPIPNTDYAWENTYGLTILPNYLDLDSDNDEIDDLTEGYSTVDLTYPSITTDSDGDGILDLWDINSGGSPISPEDTDGDLMPDYVDDDTDDDAIPDFIEGNDLNQDFVPDIAKSNTDNNANGIDDAVDNYCSGVSSIYNSATDHGEEDNSDGYMYLSSSDLELVNDGSTHQTVGIYFPSVNIAQGATISNAYIQFQTDEVSTGSVTFTIKGQDVNNASAFNSNDYNISSRTTTTASATWSPADWNTVGQSGTNQRTVDISSIIQEIVNRGGWSSGNSIVIIITGADNSSNYRTAETNPTLQISVPGGLSYGCGTNIARQDTDNDGEKDWRDDQDDSGSLPVELISQSAEYHDGKVELTWKTLSEINNHYFIVQRSQDGENFEEIGQVAGSGTTNTAKNYKFDDNNPYKGISYYQLIQVDFDGTKNPLPIMFVEASSPFESKVYPNPAKEILFIQSNSKALIEVFDIAGRQVKSQPIMEGLFQMNVKEFESGVYFFTLTSGDQRTTHRVIIQ